MNAIRILTRPNLDMAHPAFPRTGLKTASVFKVAKVSSLSESLMEEIMQKLNLSGGEK